MAQYDVNLREYWRIVRKRKFSILVIALLLGTLSTVFAFLRAPTPIYSTECVIEDLQGKVEVSRQKFSSILNIKATDESPLFAQELANTVALVYRELHGEQQTRRTRDALRYIDDQLKEVREKLRDAEERFNRFSKDNELLSIDLQSENLVAQAQEIQRENARIVEEKAEFEAIAERLGKFIDNPVGAGHNFDSVKANSRYHNANDALVSLLLRRDTLLREYTPKHPDIMAVNDEILENAKKMAHFLHLQIRSIERRQEDLSRDLERLESRTRGMLDKKLEFNHLQREVELYTDMTTLLERKNQEGLIKRSERPEEVNIVKPALLPSSPINPPRSVATGVMGVLIAFVLETFDTSLGAIEDVEETLKTPVLGVIPQVDARDIQETLQEVGTRRASMNMP